MLPRARRWSLGIGVMLHALSSPLALAQGNAPAAAARSGIERAILEWLKQGGAPQLYAVYGAAGAIGLLLILLIRQVIAGSAKIERLKGDMEAARASLEGQSAEVASKAQAATDKARSKAMQLSTLFLKLKNLVGCTDKEMLLKELMAILSKGFGATRCAFFMFDKVKNELFIIKGHGLTPAQIAETTVVPGDQTMLGWTAQTMKVCTLDMLTRDNTLKGMKKNKPIDTVICAPVIVKERLVGVIHIGELRDPAEWSEVETQLFWTCCLLTGIALDKADLIEATREELVSEKQISTKSLEERKKVRGLLDKVVSPKVAAQLLTKPDSLHFEGETREMTVFFSDIKGFTSYSEGREPKEVVRILNEYLTAMTEVVFQFGGTLDKFVGDAIVAHWGALPPDPDHARLAVRAAFTMRGVLAKLHEKWKLDGKEPLSMGMGVHTGSMVFGGIGSPQKIDFTVIGDNVNLCSRIESLTRRFNNDLIISDETYQRVKDIAQVKALGSLQVKGKVKPVSVYEVGEVDMTM